MNIAKIWYKTTGQPLTETDIKFDTYQKYLECFSDLFNQEYSCESDFVTNLFSRINPSQLSNVDLSILRRFLFIAWNTEYLSQANDARNVEFIKVNNHWKPIQSYYAVYSMGEAVAYLMDRNSPESHAGCLKKLNRLIVEQLRITPWAYAYSGSLRNGTNPRNFPADLNPVSNLTRNDYRSVDMVATCLRAEVKNLIEEFEPRKGQFKKDHDPGYVTLLNFLYRLRIKSNYKDVEIFITEAPERLVTGFSNNLSTLVSRTFILFEVYIIRRLGLSNFLALVNEYDQARGSFDGQSGINFRLQFYSTQNTIQG